MVVVVPACPPRLTTASRADVADAADAGVGNVKRTPLFG